MEAYAAQKKADEKEKADAKKKAEQKREPVERHIDPNAAQKIVDSVTEHAAAAS